MGSALTVLLSFSRTFNLTLAATLALSGIFPAEYVIGVMLFLLVAGPSYGILANILSEGIFNYHSTPLNPLLEIALVYLLGFWLYWLRGTKELRAVLTLLGIVYTYFVYIGLFPSGEGIDRFAADHFWKNLLK